MKYSALLLFCLPLLAAAAPFTAIGDGEKLTYKVGFAIFSHAGDITIAGRSETTDGKELANVTVDTRSRGIVRGLYEFDSKAEAVIDRPTGRLLAVRETGADPKRPIDNDFKINYEKRLATYTDRVRTGRSAELQLPEDGDPLDLISALVQTREWNLKPGEKRDIVVQFARDFYAISIYAEGYEEVRTPLGRYKTLVLVPRMEKDPKGLFKRGGEIKVWVSETPSRQPVQMQLKLNFGTALLTLAEHTITPSSPVTPAVAP
ncbi:MAG TPA: DUF3108 domain-containing protein [Lacunisphaera sp.]|nr:DUF3108 domain-containing protein [Lacunisphaera sp.]